MVTQPQDGEKNVKELWEPVYSPGKY